MFRNQMNPWIRDLMNPTVLTAKTKLFEMSKLMMKQYDVKTPAIRPPGASVIVVLLVRGVLLDLILLIILHCQRFS